MGRVRVEDESIVINRNKIYTSYYARATKIFPDNMLVAISIGIPQNFNGVIYRKLNPSTSLLSAYKSGSISDDEYAEIYYNETLSLLEPSVAYNELKGKVLLCYCGKDKFCHRKLVLDWLVHELGNQIYGGEI